MIDRTFKVARHRQFGYTERNLIKNQKSKIRFSVVSRPACQGENIGAIHETLVSLQILVARKSMRVLSSQPMGIEGPSVKTARGRETWSFMAELCWHALHFIITIIAFVTSLINKLWYHLLAKGSLEKYKASQGKKPEILGVVVESQEAKDQMPKICELLHWLADIGVQHVSLYDMEGVLKHSKRSLEKTLSNLSAEIRFIDTWDEGKKQGHDFQHNVMTVELLSVCDGKEGIAKAARYLCSNTLQKIKSDGKRVDLKLTEADIDRGLRASGRAGPEPDLLLVFGFTRCLLGFPAWRLRFTEIMLHIQMNWVKSQFSSFGRSFLMRTHHVRDRTSHPAEAIILPKFHNKHHTMRSASNLTSNQAFGIGVTNVEFMVGARSLVP